MKEYEGIVILKTNLTEEISKKVLAQLEGEISKNGGNIDKVENWGKRNLAYTVKKNKEGVYYKVNFKIEPEKISVLKNAYRLLEDILKVEILKK